MRLPGLARPTNHGVPVRSVGSPGTILMRWGSTRSAQHHRSLTDDVMVVGPVIECLALGWARCGDVTGDVFDGEVEVRRIQPYQATRRYLCPGCNQDIDPGIGHLVVVPTEAPDLRRHWHDVCWRYRDRRHPGRLR